MENTARMLPMDEKATLIMTTVGNEDSASRLSSLLVERRLAACVQELQINSRYRWNDEVRCDAEILLLVKTSARAAGDAMRLIEANHDYELPEIIALPVTAGLSGYLQWITREADGTGSREPR